MTTELTTQWNVLTKDPPGSPAWLLAHKGRYGSNDVSTIMGVNRHKSRMRLWAEMTERTEREDLSSLPHIRRGTLLEPIVLQLFAKETGKEILPSPGLVQHPTLSCVAITPDAMTDDGQAVVEVKTVGMHMRRTWMDGVPLGVHVQGAAQSWVLGLGVMYFAAFCLDASDVDEDDEDSDGAPKGDPLLLWAKRDVNPKLIEVMGNEVVAFHEDHVLKDIPPNPDDDLKAVKDAWKQEVRGKVIELPAELEIDLVRNFEIASLRTALKKEQDGCKARIGVAMQDAEYARTPGGLCVRYKVEPRKGHYVEACEPRVLRKVKAVGS